MSSDQSSDGDEHWSEVRLRADQAYHDVAQYHLTEFVEPAM
jgi:hypothetical protein